MFIRVDGPKNIKTRWDKMGRASRKSKYDDMTEHDLINLAQKGDKSAEKISNKY